MLRKVRLKVKQQQKRQKLSIISAGRTFWFLVLISSFISWTCASVSSVSESNSTEIRKNIVSSAKAQIGSKYKYAARGPNRFDCSGLVQYTFGLNDISIDGSSESMSSLAKSIDLEDIKPSDLIFFKKNGRVFHVSIVKEASPNSIVVIHSTSSRGVIEEDILNSSYWRDKIYKVISLESLIN